MIDGIKTTHITATQDSHLSRFEWWEITVNEHTGEQVDDRRHVKFKGLDLELKPIHSGGFAFLINGSIHKYHNDGKHNTDDFSFRDLLSAVQDLSRVLGVDSSQHALHGLEIGVNITLPFPPLRVIQNAVCYKSKRFAHINPRHIRKGIVCALSDYEVKLYDKSAQSGIDCGNVLRFEIKVKKMRFLKDFHITALSDLENPVKLYPLNRLLDDVLDCIIWKESDKHLHPMTTREKAQWLYLSNAASWESMNYEQARYNRKKLTALHAKYNIKTVLPHLKTLLQETWKKLFNGIFEAEKFPAFHQTIEEKEAEKIPGISLLECTGQTRDKTQPDSMHEYAGFHNQNNEKEQNINCAKKTQKAVRVCITCTRPLHGQKANSSFCSERLYGHSAKSCRNTDSNRRRTLKAKIERAMTKQSFISITYKTPDGQTYTDTLHATEITSVSREWLDTVQEIKILPTEKSDCSDILTDAEARSYLNSLNQ